MATSMFCRASCMLSPVHYNNVMRPLTDSCQNRFCASNMVVCAQTTTRIDYIDITYMGAARNRTAQRLKFICNVNSMQLIKLYTRFAGR